MTLSVDLTRVPLVIYHANCADGFCAAWLMWRFCHTCGSQAEYLPAKYGDKPPDVTGRTVFVLDFSYPRAELIEMHSKAKSLLVLDHHKTAEADLAGLDFCKFDMNKSGARMTWEYVSNGNGGKFWPVDYTEDRDLWRWALPNSREVNAALRSYPMTFDSWDKLNEDGDRHTLAREGTAILRAERQVIDLAIKAARKFEFDGFTGMGVNATAHISETAGELAKGRDFGLCWFETSTGDRVFSLRSTLEGCDVSAICKKRGGGGHKNAAGFTVKNAG